MPPSVGVAHLRACQPPGFHYFRAPQTQSKPQINMKPYSHLLAVLSVAGCLTLTNVLRAADAPAPEQKPRWVSSAGLNFTLTEGNAQTLLVGVTFDTVKRAKNDEYLLGASLAYGENDGTKNVETYRAYGQWNHLFNERFYGFVRGDALHDGIADVNYRLSITPGLGYYLIKNERTLLSVEAGPGYVFERQAGVNNDFPTLRLGERFEHKLSKSARVWQSAEILPDLSDFDKYIVNAELGVEAALTDKLSLRSVLSNIYNSEPALGRKKNDVKLITGINYKF
jgi:putative salt-induced outer membrane protein YdiY